MTWFLFIAGLAVVATGCWWLVGRRRARSLITPDHPSGNPTFDQAVAQRQGISIDGQKWTDG